MLPPLAVLVGIALTSHKRQSLDSRRPTVDRAFVFLGVMGGLAAFLAAGIYAWYRTAGRAMFAHTASPDHTQAYTNYFSPLFHLPGPTLAALLIPLLGTLVTLSVGMLSAWWLNRGGRRIGAVLVLSLMMGVFGFLTVYSLHLCEGILSSKSFGIYLAQTYRPGDQLIVVGDFETANSINFYAPIRLLVYEGSAATLDYGLHYPDAPRMILERIQLESLWRAPGRTFLLAPSSRRRQIGLSPIYEVRESSGRVLFCNQLLLPAK